MTATVTTEDNDAADRFDLAELFVELSTELNATASVQQTLDDIVRIAVEVVPACDYAGVSWLLPHGAMESPAATDEIVRACDTLQHELGEGPCIESVGDGVTVVIPDLACEQRWPNFAQRASSLGLRSLLSQHLASPRRTLGALNFYSRTSDAFDEESQQLARIYAGHASIALANRVLEGDLKSAIETRGLIGQAIGILVERHKLTPGQAFDMLVRGSQRLHVKLRELAAQVVETGQDPAAIVRRS